MQLNKKRNLAARTLNVGKNRILFNQNRLDEIKDAITKQDVRDLVSSGAISIREVHGRKKNRAGGRRRIGSIKIKVRNRKSNYIVLVRKLRSYIGEIKKHGTISKNEYAKLRKEIRAKIFRSKSHMKERVELLMKERK